MNTAFFAAALLLLTLTAVQGQDDFAKRYAAVNAQARHSRRVERNLTGLSAEGGTLTGWFNGQKLSRLTARLYGETGQQTAEYSFWSGHLFFVLQTTRHYKQPLGAHVLPGPEGAVAHVEQSRYYFQNGRLMRWLEGRQPQTVNSPAARIEAQRLRQEVQEFTARLRQEKPDD